jgi:integrase
LAASTVASHRQILNHDWRPHIGHLPFLGIQHSLLVKIGDSQHWNKKTYNNSISTLRRAFDFGYLDYPERRDPAAALKCSRMSKRDRPAIDPFTLQDAEVLIAALHRDWGQPQGNYDELRFFTGLRPSEEIALGVTDYNAAHGTLSVTKARVQGIDKDCTKTGEDRTLVLCPRAIAIIERQLRLRRQWVRTGRIDHEHLFFTDEGRPTGREASVYTLAAHARAPRHSLPEAVHGTPHVCQLEPHDRSQSPVRSERARAPYRHHAVGVWGVGRRSGGGGHRAHS